MTTIEYGGGPDIDQRREFSGLKEGAHIPGYQGHCPQLKYGIGKTYGRETSELNQIRRCRRHQLSGSAEQCEETEQRRHLGSDGLIPESTGDNKYTQNMVPGYTGYVPRWPYKFGRTYKEECDLCLAEFFSGCRQTSQIENEMKVLSKSQSNLRAISSDPEVKDRLNAFSDRKGSTLSGVATHRRQTTEAPMPGYRGFVPRIQVTELGLGSRYHEATENALNSFYTQHAERSERLGTQHTNFGARRLEPITINRNPVSATSSNGRRIYIQDGMIPKYTGFVPQQRYAIGNTYGDETRSLEVCAHDQSSFGEYVKMQDVSESMSS